MDYPSNSHASRNPPPDKDDTDPEETVKVQKVVVGTVSRRKSSLGQKFMATFIVGDAKNVFEYVVKEILIPAIKDTLADMLSQGIEKTLFGDARSTSRRTGRPPVGATGYVNYSRFSQPSYGSRPDPRQATPQRSRIAHNFDDIVLDTRGEAETVIEGMFELLSKYQIVTVANLYDLCGVTGTHIDEKWGWTDLRGSGVERIPGGYLLDLPKVEPIRG